MGLQVIDQSQWLRRSKTFQTIIEQKRYLLKHHKDSILATQPGTAQDISELLQLVHDTLDLRDAPSPKKMESSAEGSKNTQNSALDSLAALTLLAEEDFCLLSPNNQGDYCLRAATLCAPTFWLLEEKLGKPIQQIHQPIPGFKEQLDHKVARFFSHIKAGQWLVRYNWTLSESPERFQPTRIKVNGSPQASNSSPFPCFLRTERQVFTKLSRGFLVFSILVDHIPINELREDPGWCREFMGLLNQLSPEMIAYKGIGHLIPVAKSILQQA